jgi:hypothetical protein
MMILGNRSQEVEREVLRPVAIRIHTHMGTRMSTLTRIPLDPTPILPQVKTTLGADTDRGTLTWTK